MANTVGKRKKGKAPPKAKGTKGKQPPKKKQKASRGFLCGLRKHAVYLICHDTRNLPARRTWKMRRMVRRLPLPLKIWKTMHKKQRTPPTFFNFPRAFRGSQKPFLLTNLGSPWPHHLPKQKSPITSL